MTAKNHHPGVSENGPRVALAPFLSNCPEIITLGIRPCLDDYTAAERALLRTSQRIFFPTPRFIDIFQALDKPTFPNPTTYRYQRSRVLQQLLCQYLAIDRPRTRIYFGRRQKAAIQERFSLPVQILGPLVAPDTSHDAGNSQELQEWAEHYNPVIVRQGLSWEHRIQLVCVQYECIGILRRTPHGYEGLTAEPAFCTDARLRQVIDLALDLLPRAQLDDILLDWGYAHGRWQLLGMCRPPRRWRGPQGIIDRHRYICDLVQTGRL